MSKAPVVVFAYNRPDLLKQTIEALQRNHLALETDLVVFSDGHKGNHDLDLVKMVRFYLSTITGFKTINIIERDKNHGLSNSIIEGVSFILNKYEKIIVLEDDLVTSPYFLKFMNDYLDLYEQEEDVISVQGYVYPLKGDLPDCFFIKGADCQGWGTWKRGWALFEVDGKKLLNELKERNLQKKFNFDNTYPYTDMLKNQINGKVNSWAIRWYASAYLKDKYILYPRRTLIYNSGFGEGATNTADMDNSFFFNSEINSSPFEAKKILVKEDNQAREAFKTFFRSITPSLYKKVTIKIKNILRKHLNP